MNHDQQEGMCLDMTPSEESLITGDGGSLAFDSVTIAALEAADDALLDGLTFGVVGLDARNITSRYNLRESQLAGLSRDSVVGQDFFMTTGICMNNFLVAQRFEDEAPLDVVLDYVLTLRMRPTPVKLRLLKQPTIATRYVLIQR
jgi:photoactive yellow protein